MLHARRVVVLMFEVVNNNFCCLCSGGGSRRNHFNQIPSETRQFTMFPLRYTWSTSKREITFSKYVCAV